MADASVRRSKRLKDSSKPIPSPQKALALLSGLIPGRKSKRTITSSNVPTNLPPTNTNTQINAAYADPPFEDNDPTRDQLDTPPNRDTTNSAIDSNEHISTVSGVHDLAHPDQEAPAEGKSSTSPVHALLSSTSSCPSQTGQINCICGDPSETKHDCGTVQCVKCLDWSHMACHSLDETTAAQVSFVFTCSSCEPAPRTKGAHPQLPQNKKSNEGKSLSSISSVQINEVAQLKVEVNSLKSLVKSLQLQLMLVQEEVSNIAHARSVPLQRQSSTTNVRGRPYRVANGVGPLPRSRAAPPGRTSLTTKTLPGGSVSYFISPPKTNNSPDSDVNLRSRPTYRSSSNPPTRYARRSNTSSRPYRIIWGTRFRTTEEEVRSLIITGLNDELGHQLVVKKSVRKTENRANWWFTICSSPLVLSAIESKWSSIAPTESWHLCSALSDRPRPAAHKSQHPLRFNTNHHVLDPVIQE